MHPPPPFGKGLGCQGHTFLQAFFACFSIFSPLKYMNPWVTCGRLFCRTASTCTTGAGRAVGIPSAVPRPALTPRARSRTGDDGNGTGQSCNQSGRVLH